MAASWVSNLSLILLTCLYSYGYATGASAHATSAFRRVLPRSPRQDNIICDYIVRSLPIAIHHPFWTELIALSERTSFSRSIQTSDWLMDQCRHRFSDLMIAHHNNIQQTGFKMAWDRHEYYEEDSRDSLIVLDLDESILLRAFTF